MKTKQQIANEINYTAKSLVRQIGTDRKINLIEGEMYDNRNKPESWSEEGTFYIESDYDYKYVFYANNVPCHKVDYDNEEEVEILCAYECEDELVVSEKAMFEIEYVSTDDDFEEIGYYSVDLKFIGFKE